MADGKSKHGRVLPFNLAPPALVALAIMMANSGVLASPNLTEIRTASPTILVAYFKDSHWTGPVWQRSYDTNQVNTSNLSLWTLNGTPVTAIDAFITEANAVDYHIYLHVPALVNGTAYTLGGAILQQDYKLIEYYENNTAQLFNLKDDPAEQHDLARAESGKVEELRAMFHAWRKDVTAEMPAPNPGFDPNQKWPAGEQKDEP